MWRPENNFRELLTSFLHCGTQGWNSSCRVCMAMSLCFDPPHQHYLCSWRQGLIATVALSSPYSVRWLWSPDLLPPKCWSHRHGPPCQSVPFAVHSILLWIKRQPWKEPQHSSQDLSNVRCTKAKKSPWKFGSGFFHPGSCCFYQSKISNVNYFLEGQPQTKWRSQSKVLRRWCKCPQLVWLRVEGTFQISDRIRSQACRFLYQVPPDLTFIMMSCWHQLLFWNFYHGT